MPVKLAGSGIPEELTMFVTSKDDDCKNFEKINSSDIILVPANSVVTFCKE